LRVGFKFNFWRLFFLKVVIGDFILFGKFNFIFFKSVLLSIG
jgi:hypothetical protein